MKFFKSRLFHLILVIAGLFVLVTLSRSIYTLWRRRDIVKERETVLAQVKEENAELQAKRAEIETPEFIEREARNKLGLVREGEVVVLLPKQAGREQAEAEEEKRSVPNWRQWWQMFF